MRHPSSVKSFLPSQLENCVNTYFSMHVAARVQMRVYKLKFWMRRMLQLQTDEEALRHSFNPEVGFVAKRKYILVWKEMLQSIGHGDMGVIDEFCRGTSLSGPTELTGIWPKKFSFTTMMEDDLREMSIKQRSSLTYEQVVFFDEEIASSFWTQTLGEVEKGDVDGPLHLSQVPDGYPLSRRFGIRQGGKIRCVDDFSSSGVNSTSQPMESPKPHTLDVLAGLMSAKMELCDSESPWMSRSFDLKSAYRQCAISPESQHLAHIVVGDPTTRSLKAFRMRALRFGSVKSVHSFLRVSASIWSILTEIFGVLSTSYFDDFVAVADAREASNVDHTVKSVFKLLGCVYAEDGPKAPPFAGSVTALGVCIDVS